MEINERIQKKFDDLINEGKKILNGCGWNGKEYSVKHPSTNDYMRFRTESLNLINRVCGSESDHYAELKRLSEEKIMTANSYYFINCYGILEAAKNDYEGGYLFDLRALVAAEVLGDFIEQAETLIENGYYVPAASLAGAILEDTLRKICLSRSIPVPDKTKIDKLNADLAKVEIYSKLVQKRITALADIRNNADHGHFDKFNKEDVRDMVGFVRKFTSDYLD